MSKETLRKKKLDAFVETLEVMKEIDCRVIIHYLNGRLKITVKVE